MRALIHLILSFVFILTLGGLQGQPTNVQPAEKDATVTKTPANSEATAETKPAEKSTDSAAENIQPAADKIVFAAGFSGGTYFRIADSLDEAGVVPLKVNPTRGSTENLSLLKANEAQLALCQVDILTNRYLYDRGVKRSVKIILPVYNEELHIFAKNSIKKLTDLKGKKIALGSKNSGTNVTARIVLGTSGINKSNSKLHEVGSSDALTMLKNDNLDALFLVAGSPVTLLADLAADNAENYHLVSLQGAKYDLLVGRYFPYEKVNIAANTYVWQKAAVQTLAAQSLIVGRADLPDATIDALVRQVFNKKTKLESIHPKWKQLELEYAKAFVKAQKRYFHPAAIKAIETL